MNTWDKGLKKNCHILIPIIMIYLLTISYYPQLFKFFGNEYYQLLSLIVILGLHFWKPTLSWTFGILFLLTYRFYHQTQFIKEAFFQKSSLPPEKTKEDIDTDIKHKLTEQELSVIQNIR